MNEEKKYLIALCSFIPLGVRRIGILYKYFGSYKKIWYVEGKDLLLLGLKPRLISEFADYRKKFDIDNYLDKVFKRKIKIISVGEENYPKNLKEIEDCPLCIYVLGKIKKSDKKSISIIGSRKISDYGKKCCEYFSGNLARKGFVIVSGMARGIDSVAHISCLKQKGRTIGVLGTGIDRIYPPENKNLFEKIVQNGAVITEYPLGYPPYPENFIVRNRIITGLSKATLVIEGAEKSGTLVSSSYAANQGKSVFVVPGRINDDNSYVTNMLIKNGAFPATSWQDIVEAVKI